MTRTAGYSLLELLVAMAIVAAIAVSLFGLVAPAQSAFAAQPEAADMQQRLRVAADALSRDLAMAGAGAYEGGTSGASGGMSGPLGYYFAPVLPYFQGDVAGAFRTDAITVLYVGSAGAQTTTSADTTSSSGTLTLNSDAGCPPNVDACGFAAGDTVLAYDSAGHFDTFTLNAVLGNTLSVALNEPVTAPPTSYKSGSKVVTAIERTYALKTDPVSHLTQLVYYDSVAGGDVPVADHIVGLRFDYYGDPQPPHTAGSGACDPHSLAPCTTYGPAPPDPALPAPTLYPPGENCVFTTDPITGLPAPRLAVLGGDPGATGLILLTEAQLTDGPWCPDAGSANRYDADLLRVRAIAVTLRVESASDATRGPAGLLFTRGGTAKDAKALLPDQEITFQISPRNLDLWR